MSLNILLILAQGFLGKMYASIGASKSTSICPVHAFVTGKSECSSYYHSLLNYHCLAEPLISKSEDGEPVMYEPLAWWYGQRCSGNEYEGLTQMALDVLSTPGKLVTVILLNKLIV